MDESAMYSSIPRQNCSVGSQHMYVLVTSSVLQIGPKKLLHCERRGRIIEANQH